MRLFLKPSRRRHLLVGLMLAVAISLGMYLNYANALTVDLLPTSTESNAWTAGTAGCTTATTGHTCVDEGSTGNATDYVATGTSLGSGVSTTFSIADQSNVGTATNLTVYYYARSVALNGNAPNADTVTMSLELNGTPITPASVQSMSTSFSWYSAQYSGSWTQAQVDAMKVKFTRTVVGGGNQANADDNVQISSVYVSMIYTPPVDISQAAYRWLADDSAGPSGVFAPKVDYAAGDYTTSVESTDVNGDQIADLVTSNQLGDSVSVLVGNGDGTFDPKVDYTAGDAPSSVTYGDFNGDQMIDLAVTNSTSATVSVLVGNGDGTFDPKVDYSTGTSPAAVEVGDVNGDQVLDLAVASKGSSKISIFIGNGDGTFDPKVDYTAGISPTSVTVGDVNGDQIIDLASANYDSDTVSIFIGNGDGTFDPKVDYSAGDGANSVVAADVNNDSMLDLVATNSLVGDAVSILIGNGDGTFDAKVSYTTDNLPSRVAVADFNADQYLDIVTANSLISGQMSVFLNNGDGTYAAKVNYPVAGYGAWVTTADYNGDQINDVAVAAQGDDKVSVLMGADGPPATALAAKDAAAIAPDAATGFRLRLNLGVSGAMLPTSTAFKLRYQQKSGTCSTNPAAYSDVTSSSPVRFYDKASLAHASGYVTSALDPTRSGITVVKHTYNEANPFTTIAATSAGEDALWDFSLTTATGLTPSTTYCVMATKSDNSALNSYPVIPEIVIPNSALEQSNYRFYQNANSATPGSPLAAQNAKPNVAVGSNFRLRQLLRQTNEVSLAGASFKLQAAEKITSCSAGSYSTLSTVAGSGSQVSTGFQQTASSVVGVNGAPGSWLTPDNAKTDNGTGTAFLFNGRPVASGSLTASNFGLSVPVNATINGIEFKYEVLSATDVGEEYIYLVKNGTASVGSDMGNQSVLTSSTTYTKGGASNLWGTTWTPSEINSSGFGVKFAAWVWTDPVQAPAISIDYMSLNVHYTTAPTIASFANNAGVADESVINAIGSDPTATSGSIVPQRYTENETFSVQTAIQNGENGLWDFSLRADESLIGKTYCFRVVKNDESSLASYAQYPEVTFTAAGPTLSQQLRGGQSVVNGLKRPFNW